MPRKTKRQQMLEHLALGDDNDAIALMLSLGRPGFDPASISGLDLSRVTSVERGNDGSVRITFVDRYSALNALQKDEIERQQPSLVSALRAPCATTEDDDAKQIDDRPDNYDSPDYGKDISEGGDDFPVWPDTPDEPDT